MRPEAQPRHRQDSRQAKDAQGRTSPQGDGADSASPRDGFTDMQPDAGKANTPTTGENALPQPTATGLGVDWKRHGVAVRHVRGPSFVTWN